MTGRVLLTVPLAVPGDKTVYPTLAVSSTNPSGCKDWRHKERERKQQDRGLGGIQRNEGLPGAIGNVSKVGREDGLGRTAVHIGHGWRMLDPSRVIDRETSLVRSATVGGEWRGEEATVFRVFLKGWDKERRILSPVRVSGNIVVPLVLGLAPRWGGRGAVLGARKRFDVPAQVASGS